MARSVPGLESDDPWWEDDGCVVDQGNVVASDGPESDDEIMDDKFGALFDSSESDSGD
eukprot:SAG31_NODE_3577_length_4103_cov_2.362637_6_plen_58_part_00